MEPIDADIAKEFLIGTGELALQEIRRSQTEEDLKDIRTRYLGRKGLITLFIRMMWADKKR